MQLPSQSGLTSPALSSRQAEEAISLSIAIFAWNEEAVIGRTLESLFQQTLFSHFVQRGCVCEIVCVVNGCTDATPRVADAAFSQQMRSHPFRDAFRCRVENLQQRGKLNAWNQFVHKLSAPSSPYLIMMDADIFLHKPDTLWQLVAALVQDSRASVSVDRPRKHVLFKKHRSPADWLSLAMSGLTGAASAQLCGQLYCIRSEIARNIYLPKDLSACEDGFIKALVCTDFLSRSVCPGRIKVAEGAEHLFEAYTSPRAIFKNQKRQMIGQTIVHLLVDQHLQKLSPLDRLCLSDVLRKKDLNDASWIKRLIAAHLKTIHFSWRLYPGLLTHRLKGLAKLSWPRRLLCLPAALASTGLAFFTSRAAWRALKAGTTDYWPKAPRSPGNAGVSPAISADASESASRREKPLLHQTVPQKI